MNPSLRIELFPGDLDASLAFYAALGFEVTGRNDGPPRYASVRWGGVRIGLLESEPMHPVVRSVPAGTEIVIEVDDITGFRDHVLAQGPALAEDLQQREWGLTDFRLTDPDGYYLRLTDHRGSGGH